MAAALVQLAAASLSGPSGSLARRLAPLVGRGSGGLGGALEGRTVRVFHQACLQPPIASRCTIGRPETREYLIGRISAVAFYATDAGGAKREAAAGEVRVKYEHGLATLSVPLPSRKENCLFSLRPVTSTLGDLVEQLRAEDHGADHIAAYSLDGERIAKGTTIDVLLRSDFRLVINDREYHAIVPPALAAEGSLEEASELKNTIVRLYRTLNVEQFQIDQERQLLARLEHLKAELEPLEKVKKELEAKALKRTEYMTWAGLGLMGVQFGLLARLTWWEYSWDIMEPVTYFVGYGTLIAMFIYYVLTKQEYTFPGVRDREFLLTLHRGATKQRLDLARYNRLRDQIATAEHDIARLRDPLQLNLPLSHLQRKPAPDADPFK